MRKDLFREMYQLEESYWWHVAKRRLVRKIISKYVSKYQQKSYLDVGCGTGKMMEEISKWKKWKEVIGLDGSDEAIKFCKKRGLKRVIKTNFEKKLPLTDGSIDVISSLDVVEHIQADQQLLKEFFRITKPGGLVVVTVPAYKWLWTYWDDMLQHKRRYRRSQFRSKFQKAGFDVVEISYFYSYLLPMAIVFRIIKTLIPTMNKASDFVSVPEKLNQILLKLSEWETRLIGKVNLPTGLSIVCVARKN